MCSARASAGTISPSSLLPPLIPPSLSPRYIPGVSLHVFPRASLPRPPASRKTRFARNASDEIISIRQVHQFGIEKVKSRRIGKSRYDLRALPRHISRLRGVLRCPPPPPPYPPIKVRPANFTRFSRFATELPASRNRAVLLASEG